METEPLCLSLQRPFFKLVFTPPFSPQLLKSSSAPLSVPCALELLSSPSAALPAVPLPPIAVALRPPCSSAGSKRWETAPRQVGALPNYGPNGVDLGLPGSWLPSPPGHGQEGLRSQLSCWRTKQPAGSKPAAFTSQPDDGHIAKIQLLRGIKSLLASAGKRLLLF